MTRSKWFLVFLLTTGTYLGQEAIASIIYSGRVASTDAFLSNNLVGTLENSSSGADFLDFDGEARVSSGEPLALVRQETTLDSRAIVSSGDYVVFPTFEGQNLGEVLRVASVLTVDFTVDRPSRWTMDLLLADGPYDFGGGNAGSGVFRISLTGPDGIISTFDQTVGLPDPNNAVETTAFVDWGLLAREDYRLDVSIDYEIFANIGGGGLSSYEFQLQTSPIPEPNAFIVFGTALALLVGSRRLRSPRR